MKEIEIAFNKLKRRIIKHRKDCAFWKIGKPCFNCHHNTLSKIEEALK